MAMSFLGHSPGATTTATPYQRVIEPSQLGLFLNLEQAELLRVKRYHEHWRFYIGQHWKFTREDGEPLVTINYAKKIIDKSVSWLVGSGMAIQVPQVLRNHTLPVLDEVWGYNNRNALLYRIATTGAVTGDVFILVTYAAPSVQARRINPHTRGQIRIQLLNSEQVFPQWDPMNVDVLVSVRIETIFYDDRPQTMDDTSMDHQGRQLHTRRFTQVITREAIIEQYQGGDPVTKANPLGEIPLVHIRNQEVPGEYYGLSDLDGILDLNRELNEKATDISDIINYHAAPVTVIQGAKVKNLERSPRNIWSGLPPDAKVYNLELSTDLGASIAYFDKIKESLLELADIPEGSLGKQQPISNTSGVALHTQYQPLVEKTSRKRDLYEPGLQEVNYYIIRIKETIDSSFSLPTDLCKRCGGRIVEIVNDIGRRTKRCFMVDPQTFDFLPPDEVKVRYIRQHSFGQKVEEAPYKQVLKEHRKVGPSYWDPESQVSDEEKSKRDHEEQQRQHPPEPQEPLFGPDGQELAPSEPPEVPPPEPPVPQMTPQTIELPPEPETLTLRKVFVDENGLEQAVPGGDEEIKVVWTKCERPDYLNPYDTDVTLLDTVPKDKQLEADLFEKYDMNKWVSKRWIRRKLPEVDDADQVEQEIEDEQADHSETAPQVGAEGGEGGEGGAPRSELERTVGPPFGSNLPGG